MNSEQDNCALRTLWRYSSF